jgi:hypothetical protein
MGECIAHTCYTTSSLLCPFGKRVADEWELNDWSHKHFSPLVNENTNLFTITRMHGLNTNDDLVENTKRYASKTVIDMVSL